MGVDKGGVWPPWLLDPMSSTHNESRLAACPLSGVPGRVRAPCQLIPRPVGKCAHLLGRVGRGRQDPPRRAPRGATRYRLACSTSRLLYTAIRSVPIQDLDATRQGATRTASQQPVSGRCPARAAGRETVLYGATDASSTLGNAPARPASRLLEGRDCGALRHMRMARGSILVIRNVLKVYGLTLTRRRRGYISVGSIWRSPGRNGTKSQRG